MRLSRLKQAIGITLLVAGISSCMATEAVIPSLPLPAKPTLPMWEQGALACLTEGTVKVIKLREILIAGHCGKLEGIIKSTHPK